MYALPFGSAVCEQVTLRTFIEQFLTHLNDRYFPHFLLMKTVRIIAPHQSPASHCPAFRTMATQAPEPKRPAGNHPMRVRVCTGILRTLGLGKAMADDCAACVARLQDAAGAAGVTRTVAAALDHVQADASVLALAQSPPACTMPIRDSLGFRVDQQRIADGRARMQQHAQMLRAAEQHSGVNRDVLTAVWGVETDDGNATGKPMLPQALATLVCAGDRRVGCWRRAWRAAPGLAPALRLMGWRLRADTVSAGDVRTPRRRFGWRRTA